MYPCAVAPGELPWEGGGSSEGCRLGQISLLQESWPFSPLLPWTHSRLDASGLGSVSAIQASSVFSWAVPL